MQRYDETILKRLWWPAFSLFVLAAGTGAWLRFGTMIGFPGNMQYSNIRHAHSHLMYFGWVTPALMVLMAAHLAQQLPAQKIRPFLPIIRLTFLFALLAYAAFLFYGYRSAPVAGRMLPLSVMAAGLNVIVWYAFAWQYRRATRGLPRTLPIQLWDAAILFMLLASLGGWGLPLVTLLDVQSPLLHMALTHLFLDTFADGWFVLVMLGLLYAATPTAVTPLAYRSHSRMVMGLPVLFLLGIPSHLLTWPLQLIGGIAGLLVGWGLLGHVKALWSAAPLWRIPLLFLALKAVGQLAVTVPPVAAWSELARLRVPYLHWLLLGFVTLGLATAVAQRWRDFFPYRRGLVTAVVLLQISLMPLTSLWPAAWRGAWIPPVVAWAALGPVLISLLIILRVVTNAWPGRELSQTSDDLHKVLDRS